MPVIASSELAKHSVRRDIWLPACKRRLDALRETRGTNAYLRYFTFSNGDALDPIFLFLANILEARSETGIEGSHGLTTVHFFDRSAENAQPVIRDLPGAKPFGGSFVDTVLFDPESPQPSDPDSQEANEYGNLKSSNKRFRQFFPFDIINFDWNELLLDGADPSRLLEALRRVFEWERDGGDNTRPIDAFALSIAVRKPDPVELSPAAIGTLQTTIGANIVAHPRLANILSTRCGASSANALATSHWEDFVALGMPKVILSILADTGWVPDPTHPLQQVRRPSANGSAELYQIVIELIRQDNGSHSTQYGQAVEMVFGRTPAQVTVNNPAEVGISLRDVYARRDLFRNGVDRV